MFINRDAERLCCLSQNLRKWKNLDLGGINENEVERVGSRTRRK